MARIPLSGISVNVEPVASGEGGPEFAAARGLGRMTESLAALADQQQLEHARMERSDAITGLLTEINGELEAIQSDANRIDGQAFQFEERFNRRADELMEGITSGPAAQLQFRDQAVDLIRQGRASAFSIQHKRQSARALNQLNAELEEVGRNAIAVGTDVGRFTAYQRAEEAINSYAAAGWTDAAGADAIEREMLADLDRNFVRDRYGKRQFALLHAELKAGEYPYLSPDDRVQIEAAASSAQSVENAADIEKQILFDPLSVSRDDIYAQDGKDPFAGGITTDQANGLYSMQQYRVKQAQAETDLMGLGMDILTGQEPFKFNNKDHKKGFDLAFDAVRSFYGIEDNVSDPKYQEFVAKVSTVAGGIPISVRDKLLSTINSPSAQPQARLDAANLVHAVRQDGVVDKQFAMDADTAVVLEWADEAYNRQRAARQGSNEPVDPARIVGEIDEDMKRRMAGRESSAELALTKHLDGTSLNEYLKNRTVDDPFFARPIAGRIQLGEAAGPVEPYYFGLLGGATLEDAFDRIEADGGDPFDPRMMRDLEQNFQLQWRRGHGIVDEDKMLENAWKATLTEWGVSKLMGVGTLHWEWMPVDQYVHDGFFEDVANDIIEGAARIGPIDLRKDEPNFGERFEALWAGVDPFGVRAAYETPPDQLSAMPAADRVKRALALMGQAPFRAMAAGALALTDLPDPQKRDEVDRWIERLSYFNFEILDSGARVALKELADSAEAFKRANPTWPPVPVDPSKIIFQKREIGDTENIGRVKPRGFFSSVLETHIGADFRFEHHPLSWKLGKPYYQIVFADAKGNTHVLPISNLNPLPAPLEYNRETSPTLAKRKAEQDPIDKEKAEAKRLGAFYRQGAITPERTMKSDRMDQVRAQYDFFTGGKKSSDESAQKLRALELYRNTKAEFPGGPERDAFMPDDLAFRRISRDPALAYAHLQLWRETLRRRKAGQDTTSLEHAEESVREILDRGIPR